MDIVSVIYSWSRQVLCIEFFLATGLLLTCLQTGVPKNLSEKYNKINENKEEVIFLKVSHRQLAVTEIYS